MSYVTGRWDDDRSMNFLIKAPEHRQSKQGPWPRPGVLRTATHQAVFGLAGGSARGKPEPDPGHGLTALI